MFLDLQNDFFDKNYDFFHTGTSSLSLLTTEYTFSAAYDEAQILSPGFKNNTIFLVKFYNDGSRSFSKDENLAMKEGFRYWAHILQKADMPPVNIAVKTYDEYNAKYSSDQNLLNPSFRENLHRFFHKVSFGLVPPQVDGTISIGSDYSHAYLGPQSHLPPLQEKADLYGVIIHEFGHALFGSSKYNDKGFFDVQAGEFGGLNAHNVNAVLEVNKPGADLKKVPINKDGYHIELRNSAMSAQNYRNHTRFMEVELALLQDVGWTIPRRNFYGYSLYRNGQTILNENGYFALNPEGTDYLVGTYNAEPDGVGLHIYGSHNHVTQKANIFTKGTRAVGARVDGESNTLVIDKDTIVDAIGSDGIGILFAYGKNHRFVLHGKVRADGQRGIGLSFDFGGNYIGTEQEERGSYWRTIFGGGYGSVSPLDEHNGPLAKSVVISGTLFGGQKALYMSKTGYVEKITITPNSHVKGDIVSEYNRTNPAGKPYLTSLIFGPENLKDTVEGQKFIYTDNIQGKNIEAQFTGPYTALYRGHHKLYSATIAPGATLVGNSTFTIKSPLGFTNSGTLSLGSADFETFIEGVDIGTMTIEGNYQQKDTGRLVIDVSRRGKTDLLHVTGEAQLAGTLEVRPQRTFYPNYWEKEINFLQADGGIKGDFSQKITTPSPTLTWNFIKNDHTYGLTSPFKKADPDVQQQAIIEQSRHGVETINANQEGEQHLVETIAETEKLQNVNQGREVTQQASQQGMTECNTTHHSDTEPSSSADDTEAHSIVTSTAKQKSKAPEVGKEEKQQIGITHQATPSVSGQQHVVVAKVLAVMSRPSNAYSQYATDANERSVGRVLDRVVDKADKSLQSLYEALDFSALDGSEVRSALAQLSPVAYGGAFGVSLRREHQISDTLNERPSSALAPGQWQAFALPFVSQTNSKARDLQVGANLRTTGLIAGIEHHTSSTPGLTWGFHGVIGNKASLTLNTADNARGFLQAWGVGMQLRYQPNLLIGPYLSAQARMGLEQGNLTRTLAVNGYKGQQQAKWQGMTTTTSVLGGYLWKIHDHLSLGPILGLDYTTLTHPQITEKGPSGISMALEKARYHSLQSSLGIQGVVSINQKLKLDLQARWDRELLNTTLTQKARFANIADSVFNTKTRVGPRDALNVSGQATYELSETVSLGARASAQFARSQKTDLIGNISLNVKF